MRDFEEQVIDSDMSVSRCWLAAEATAKLAESELRHRTRLFWSGLGDEPLPDELQGAKAKRVEADRLFGLVLLEMDQTTPKYFSGRAHT